MSFQNAKTKIGKERVLFQGIGKITPIAVNPNAEELRTLLGTENIQEPSYINDRDGRKTTRIDIWHKPEEYDTYSKMSFYLEHEPQPSSNGNYLIINDFLQNTYGKSIEDVLERIKNDKEYAEWFQTKGLRISHGNATNGEVSLLNYLCTLCNIDYYGNNGINFENFQAILNGDVSEIRNIIDTFSKESPLFIKVLHGVRVNDEGKTYQELYTGKVASGRSNKFSFIANAAKNEYGGFKHDWGNDVTFRIYDSNIKNTDKNEGEAVTAEAGW